MQKTIKAIFTDRTLQGKLLAVMTFLLITRFIAAIPLPGVDNARLADFFAGNQLFNYLSIFSGSGFSTFSVALLGLGPYITASILVQVSSLVFPQVKKIMHEEGEIGRKKISQYTRLLTVPFAFIQGFAFIKILSAQGLLTNTTPFVVVVNICAMVAGTMMLLWIGEKITEYGIGNGTSLIIFSGIAAGLPALVSQVWTIFDPAQIPLYIVTLVLGLAIIALVVYVNEAERKVPITYARAHAAQAINTYLPLKLNQAGMIPIIFALALFTMPRLAGQFFSTSSNPILKGISEGITTFFSYEYLYMILYFVIVGFFTYFYTSVVVEPEEISKNLHKRGAYIPGIRPGENTTEYIRYIVSRITFVGAVFLGAIAVLPIFMQAVTGIATLAIGGTSILIAVSTALETYKKVEAQATLAEY
jgi:preprotein translocase subunit SecY